MVAVSASKPLPVQGVAGTTVVADPANAVVSDAGGAAVRTLAAEAGKKAYVGDVVFAYDATPPAGATLTVTDDGAVVWQVAVTSAGPGPLAVNIEGADANTAMVITLSAGGGSVLAYLNTPGAIVK